MTDVPKRLGVVGAGTMGAGIAQLGCLAGIETVLHDPFPEALERGVATIHENIDKGVRRGRWSADGAAIAHERIAGAESLEALTDCDFVIEAAPEQFDLKRDLFQSLGDLCSPEAVLASNTSSIPITQIAGVARRPEQVVGLHFFNPAPLMKLVEAIPGLQTSGATLAAARALGEAMGKRVIVATDGPGFLVNRCGRPFGSEALRILQERLATVEQIDMIYRQGGGYKMGPFELMDLVGIDVGFAVAKSFTELSFGEPRWKPNPLQARMVAAGRLGRKTGHGWYDYGKADRPRSASGPDRRGQADRPLSASDSDRRGQADSPLSASGLDLLNRVQCCIVNEGVFALYEGVGSAEDIDAGTKLGLGWPKGPLELGRELGFDHVLATMDALFERYREERYRAAPPLRDGLG